MIVIPVTNYKELLSESVRQVGNGQGHKLYVMVSKIITISITQLVD